MTCKTNLMAKGHNYVLLSYTMLYRYANECDVSKKIKDTNVSSVLNFAVLSDLRNSHSRTPVIIIITYEVTDAITPVFGSIMTSNVIIIKYYKTLNKRCLSVCLYNKILSILYM